MDIEFTTKAQDALGAAIRRAAANGNAEVQPVHLLDALLGQGEGIATSLLTSVGVDLPVLTSAVKAEMARLPSASGQSVGTPSLSRAMYAVLQAAQDLAKSRGDDYVSTEHLLVGLSSSGGTGVSAPGSIVASRRGGGWRPIRSGASSCSGASPA